LECTLRGVAPMTSKLPQPPTDCISRVRFAPLTGSSLLLVSSWDSHVRLYDAATGMLAGMHRQGLAVLDCAFLGEDGSRCLSGGLDRRLFCFDFQRQQETIIGQHDEAIRCVEYHKPSQQVFTASWDRTLRGWDPRRQPATPSAAVRVGAKAFAMDVCNDKVLIGGSDRHVHIFDVRRLNSPLERRDTSLRNEIRVLKVGIDQRSYTSGSVEGRCAIEYIDPEENGRSKYAFKCHRTKDSTGEAVHPVNALSYHPVHGTFATGGSDGGVCVWDGYAKKRLWRLNPFDTSVSSLCFSADGTRLAIGVSYTFDQGDKSAIPAPELAVRQITESEVLPKVTK